jgi:hypothetical protein
MTSVPIPAEVVAAEMALVRQPETIQPQVCGALHSVLDTQVGEEVVQVGEAFAAGGEAHEPHALKYILVCFRDRPTKLRQLYIHIRRKNRTQYWNLKGYSSDSRDIKGPVRAANPPSE